METAGVVIGAVTAVGLIGQIFDGCLKAYSCFTAAANLGKDSEKLLCKVRIEEMRLMVWGREWGVKEGRLEQHLASSSAGGNEGLKRLAEMILKQLLDTIGDSKKLKERYGIKEESSSSKSAAQSPRRPLEDPLSNWGDLKLRARWVICDRDKFEELVKDLKDYNDGLERLFPPARIATLQRTWTNELLYTAKRDMGELSLLETASSGVYPHLNTSASLKQLRINLDTTETTKFKATSELKIPRASLTLSENDGNSNRVDGLYRPRSDDEKDQAVIVEWLSYDPDTDLDTRLIIYQRVDNLARMVHSASNRHPDLHTLDCVGYLDDKDHTRYGLTYRCPAGAPRPRPDTLTSLIDNAQLRTPDLNDRFQLAHTLAVALWSFHSLDWLHKSFSSSNILFFLATADGNGTDLSQPYVTGFDSSRPEHLNEMTVAARSDVKHELYRHPDSLGIWRQSYRKSFDIYSLGLVLLEIGLWKSVKDFHKPKYTPAAFRDKVVLPVLVPRLGGKTGRSYQRVVERCLQGGGEVESADEAEKCIEWIVLTLESLKV